ncbi:DUF2726 domain-containing protein [Nitrospira defluvii]|uniref:DUF2726 domain-containing protein n=1 Tax=Nitrospira defluvii TaxID=330214 RepID=A0ABM8QM50_9BACT|nr:DUF2726 domain-containing protein [Nitrospira defluvii]CAE6704959.1 conserved hypothetical protein [Nitrospira defluvii]
MELLYPIVGIGALVFLGSLAWETFGRRRAPDASAGSPATGMTFAAKPLLTDREVQLYNLLRLAVEDRYLLFTQIPLWSILDLRAPSGTPPAMTLRELALKRATFVLVHPGSRLVEKVVQVDPPVPHDAPDAADEALFDGALRAAGVQLVRLSPLHTYTVPGLVTVLDLADPD